MLNHKVFCPEHGHVATVMSVRPLDTSVEHVPEGTYAGMHRHTTYTHDHEGRAERLTKHGQVEVIHIRLQHIEPEHRHRVILSDGSDWPA